MTYETNTFPRECITWVGEQNSAWNKDVERAEECMWRYGECMWIKKGLMHVSEFTLCSQVLLCDVWSCPSVWQSCWLRCCRILYCTTLSTGLCTHNLKYKIALWTVASFPILSYPYIFILSTAKQLTFILFQSPLYLHTIHKHCPLFVS